jgi:ATP-binding cassette subfamily B protein
MPKPATATPSPGSPGPRPSLRERVGALRNIPPFLREIWGTS